MPYRTRCEAETACVWVKGSELPMKQGVPAEGCLDSRSDPRIVRTSHDLKS